MVICCAITYTMGCVKHPNIAFQVVLTPYPSTKLSNEFRYVWNFSCPTQVNCYNWWPYRKWIIHISVNIIIIILFEKNFF